MPSWARRWTARWSSVSRPRRRLFAAAAALSAWGVLGALVAPPILRRQIESALRDATRRPATVQQVRLNPFALSLTVRGLSVTDLDGGELAGFDELYVNFQLSSLFRGAWTFDEFSLRTPRARIVILPDGSLQIADLLEPGPDKSEPPVPAEAPSAPPSLLVFALAIEQGRLDFEDLSRGSPFRRTVAPIDLHLTRFSTAPDDAVPYSFSAEIGSGETIRWQGDLVAFPLRSSGRFALEGIRLPALADYLQPVPGLTVAEGRLDVAGRYAMDTAAGTATDTTTGTAADTAADTASSPMRFTLAEGEVMLHDLLLRTSNESEPLLALPLLAVQGIAADSEARAASVASVRLADAALRLRRERDGTLELGALFAPPPSSPSPGTPVPAASAPWTVTLDELAVESAALRLEDRAPVAPVLALLKPVRLTVRHFDSRPGAAFDTTFDATVDGAGTIGATASVALSPLAVAASVRIEGLELPGFQPYLQDAARVRLASGRLDVDAALALPGRDGGQLDVTGSVAVRDLRARTGGTDAPLVAWSALSFSGLDVGLNPTRLRIAAVEARDLDAQFVLEADGRTNLARVLGTTDAAAGTAAGVAAGAVVGAGEAGGAPASAAAVARPGEPAPVPVSIGEVRLVNATLGVTDDSVRPAFTGGVSELNGSLTGLSLGGPTAAPADGGRLDIDLTGHVRDQADLRIAGWLTLPGGPGNALGTELSIEARDIALTAFSPYSGKFAGYEIARGKLKLDLAYAIEGRTLNGSNRVVMDQFTFGGAVDSADATSLPVRLAIALLKDRNGVIDLDVPVGGNLDAPDFSYGGVVWNAFLNIIVKAATAPFSLIGGLFGGGAPPEDMDRMAFAAGAAATAPEEEPKLAALATALTERPALLLEIHGAADPAADRRALADAALDRRIAQERVGDYKVWGWREDPEAGDVRFSPRDSGRLLRRVYEATFAEAPEALLPRRDAEAAARGEDPPGAAGAEAWLVGAMRDRLVGLITIDDAAVRELAVARGRSVRDALRARNVPEAQLVILEPVLDGHVEGGRIQCALTLTGS